MKIFYFFCIVCGIYSFKPQIKVFKSTQLNTLPIRNYQNFRQYPISRPYYKNYLNRISDKGLQLGSNRTNNNEDEGERMIKNILNRNETTNNEFPDFGNVIANDSSSELRNPPPGLRIIINKDIFSPFMDDEDSNDDGENNVDPFGRFRAGRPNHRKKKIREF